MKRLFLVALLLVVLAGCRPYDPNETVVRSPEEPLGNASIVFHNGKIPVYRFVDLDFGVVCYYGMSYYGEGVAAIDCIPLADLEPQ